MNTTAIIRALLIVGLFVIGEWEHLVSRHK